MSKVFLFLVLFVFLLGSVSALPDLRVTQITKNIVPLNNSCTVTLNATIANFANFSASNSTTRFLIVPSMQQQTKSTPALAQNTMTTVVATFSVSLGNHTAVVNADFPNTVVEANENNNQLNVSLECRNGGGGGNNQTHLTCVSNTCSVVQGQGNNTCSPQGSYCGPTYLKCVNNACSVVQGIGNNSCSPQGSYCGPGHLECVNRTCTLVNSPGVDKCTGVGTMCRGNPSVGENKTQLGPPYGNAWGFWCNRLGGVFCSKEHRMARAAQIEEAKEAKVKEVRGVSKSAKLIKANKVERVSN